MTNTDSTANERRPPTAQQNGLEPNIQRSQIQETKIRTSNTRVPKKDLDPTDIENEVIIRDEIEEENTNRDLQAVQVIPLRRTRKHSDKVTAHHSIVIFTHSVEEANTCITQGMSIKGSYYYPEMYTPELNITQCYKCYKYGHIAKHCKSKQKCANCGTKTTTHSIVPTKPTA
jgi:hypothetical protein